MLIVTAHNVTEDGGARVLQRPDGTADYNVEVAININPPIWKGTVCRHNRSDGAGQLLRLIADKIDDKRWEDALREWKGSQGRRPG